MKTRLLAVLVGTVAVVALCGWGVANHVTIYDAALAIFRADGLPDVVQYFENLGNDIKQGIADADLKPTSFDPPFFPINHFMDPWKHCGFPVRVTGPVALHSSMSSGEWANLTENQIDFRRMNAEDRRKLGACTHAIGDAAMPLHSNPLAEGNLAYHGKIEDWVKGETEGKSLEQLEAEGWLKLNGGRYDVPTKVDYGQEHGNNFGVNGWVDLAAHESYGGYAAIKESFPLRVSTVVFKPTPKLKQVCQENYTRAARLVAGYLNFKYEYISPKKRGGVTWRWQNFPGDFREGEWSIRGLQVKRTNDSLLVSEGSGVGGSMVCQVGHENYEVAARGQIISPPESFPSWGIVFRGRGNDQYRFFLDPGNPAIEEIPETRGSIRMTFHGSSERLCGAAGPQALDLADHEMRIVIVGDSVRSYLDDGPGLQHQGVDTPGGGVGIYLKQACVRLKWFAWRPLP